MTFSIYTYSVCTEVELLADILYFSFHFADSNLQRNNWRHIAVDIIMELVTFPITSGETDI